MNRKIRENLRNFIGINQGQRRVIISNRFDKNIDRLMSSLFNKRNSLFTDLILLEFKSIEPQEESEKTQLTFDLASLEIKQIELDIRLIEKTINLLQSLEIRWEHMSDNEDNNITRCFECGKWYEINFVNMNNLVLKNGKTYCRKCYKKVIERQE